MTQNTLYLACIFIILARFYKACDELKQSASNERVKYVTLFTVTKSNLTENNTGSSNRNAKFTK